ncbi:hypothetical protein HDU98_010872 [Podochytrium sp. JEL0797]|nr:hypothetical protein HDU98_010872 [Podochytrium sp. JEL0797]
MASCKAALVKPLFLAHYLAKCAFLIILILDRKLNFIYLLPHGRLVVSAIEDKMTYLVVAVVFTATVMAVLEPALKRLDSEYDELASVEEQMNGVVAEACDLFGVRTTTIGEEKIKR